MSLFSELKRRNVFRVAIAYIVSAWILLQVGDLLFDLMGLPDYALRIVLGILILGFPVALVFSWAFELTPEGIKRDSEVERSESRTAVTAKKLDIVVIVLLLVGIGVVLADRFLLPESGDPQDSGMVVDELEDQAVPLIDSAPEPPIAPAEQDQITGDKSIAVLPFANMSADPENEFFADGVSEEILNRLAQVPDLRVIARTSSFAFKDDNQDLREIGRALDATYILEGSVRRQGDRARITAQLIDARDGSHLWSETYDKDTANVFEAQDQIAVAVVEAMDVILDDQARQAMENAGVRDVEAFIAYQKGVKASQDAHDAGFNVAEALVDANVLFDQAIARVPGFAEAYLQKADRYAHIVLEEGYTDEEREAAIEEMRRLLQAAETHARDPGRAAWARVDRILFSDSWASLPAALERAFEIGGCNNGNWLELVEPFAYFEDILAHQLYLTECDPLFAFPYTFVANAYMDRGDFEQARSVLDRGTATAGDHRWIRGSRYRLWTTMGEYQKAEAELNRLAGPEGEWSDGLLSRKARLEALQGKADAARRTADPVLSNPDTPPSLRLSAAAGLGLREQANAAAAELDQRPGGYAELIRVINFCYCGAPFDLSATPNLARRLDQAGFDWPPKASLDYPDKNW